MPITISPAEARAIVKDAYLYGWPLSENYNTIYAYSIDAGNPNYKAPINQLFNDPKVFTPADTAVVTPNSDTPYSFITADLRAEPLVISVPAMVPENRYFSFQLIDAYTFNMGYIGTRATGNGGGHFLLAGPSWAGGDRSRFDGIYYSESHLALLIGRTQLFEPGDITAVTEIQSQYKVQTLSAFLGSTESPVAPRVDWPAPVVGEASKTPAVFSVINFMLGFCPVNPTEVGLMKRFSLIDVGPGLPFNVKDLSPEMLAAFEAGIADAWEEFEALNRKVAAGEEKASDFFGSREYLNNNYLYRFAGAKLGIYGNSKQEAIYPFYSADDADRVPDGSTSRYTITLPEMPPAKAFWSITMYDAKTQLLVENSINRYLVNTSMEEKFVYGDDGSLTIYLQNEAPPKELTPNWLPAPAAPFYAVMRLYVPEPKAYEGEWSPPSLVRVGDASVKKVVSL
ncbi:cell envelope protein [Myxococcus xanthus]|nr:cell envelope protein [Myxococcus xanthus]